MKWPVLKTNDAQDRAGRSGYRGWLDVSLPQRKIWKLPLPGTVLSKKNKQLSIHSVDSVNAHIYMQYRAIFTGKKLDISSNICTSHCKSAENVKYS